MADSVISPANRERKLETQVKGQNNVNRHTHLLSSDGGVIPQDDGALAAAAAGVPEEKIIEGVAFGGRKRIVAGFRDHSVEGGRIAGQTVRQHPWQIAGIALGVSALLACVLTRRNVT